MTGQEEEAFRRLLGVTDSELAVTLHDGLRLLTRALDQTALLHPGDPGAEAFTEVRGVLGDLLDEPETQPTASAPQRDEVGDLLDGFYEDAAVREHLGDVRRQDDPARQWIAFNCALLRLPRKLAESWRGRAAQAVPSSDGTDWVALPALDSEEELVLPWPGHGVLGVRTVMGAAPLPEVAQALAPLPAEDTIGKAVEALASQALTLAGLDPEALYFESLTPRPRPLAEVSALADYSQELLTRLATYSQSAALEDPARALEAAVTLDEALCSVAHLPPAADPSSWWNALASRSHELVFSLAGSLAGRARVREPARRFRDVRDLTEDDVPVVSQAHPGRVIWCLRLYAEIDGTARLGRVIYGVDR